MSNDKRRLEDLYTLSSQDDVGQHYDAWAETYDHELVDENGYAMPDRVADLMASEAADLLAEPLLDVGCGTGLSGAALKAKGFSALDGCDFSAGMRAVAEQRGIYRRLFHADLNNPPIDVADGAYAAVTAVGVFANAHIKGEALDEIARCVRQGGLICVTTNDHYWAEGTLKAAMERLEQAGIVSVRVRDHGTHIAGRGVDGWVFVMVKL